MNPLVCCFCLAFACKSAKAIKLVSPEVLAVGVHLCSTMGSPSEQHEPLVFLSLAIVIMEVNSGVYDEWLDI